MTDKLNEINKIIESLNDMNKSFLSKEEYYKLNDVLEGLLDDYIKSNIRSFSNPYFHENLVFDIKNLLSIQFDFLDEDILSYTADIILEQLCKTYFKYFIPRRSYKTTFIRVAPNVEKINKKLLYLKNKPQPEQRTPEWYLFRYNLITASNAWKILDSESSKNSIIYEKCKPHDNTKYDRVNMNSPFHWGTKYEPISVQLYEEKYNTKVDDFGCIQHDTYTFLGASPDGIITDPTSNLYGRMLEIKNIVNREINGIPKMEYWIQMQLQMEVCDLNECDFLETKFLEYNDYNEFKNDGTFNKTKEHQLKGAFMLFMKDSKPYYEYPPINLTEEDFLKWESEIMEKNNDLLWVKNIYWYLHTFSCVLVLRNKPWFKEIIGDIKNIWNIIEKERIHGYEHRAPKKKTKSFDDKDKRKGCLLSLKNGDVSINHVIKINTDPLVLK